jgi:hypothetical protein
VHQASEGRDALGVRIEVLAIFLFRNFSRCFLLDDFALRTVLKTALNIEMHRSRDIFERSKRAFFCVASDFFRTGRGPSAEAGWKAALRGDREVMFEVVMTIVNYPGAEVNWCEWWIANVQRPAWHRRRACRQSETRSTIARISIASSNPRSWPSENRSEQETSSIQRSSNDHSSQRSMQRTR